MKMVAEEVVHSSDADITQVVDENFSDDVLDLARRHEILAHIKSCKACLNRYKGVLAGAADANAILRTRRI